MHPVTVFSTQYFAAASESLISSGGWTWTSQVNHQTGRSRSVASVILVIALQRSFAHIITPPSGHIKKCLHHLLHVQAVRLIHDPRRTVESSNLPDTSAQQHRSLSIRPSTTCCDSAILCTSMPSAKPSAFWLSHFIHAERRFKDLAPYVSEAPGTSAATSAGHCNRES